MKKKRFLPIILVFCFAVTLSLMGCDGKPTVYEDSFSSDSVKYVISVSSTRIRGELTQTTVTVKATAKEDLDIMLGTSGLGRSGAIWLECYMEKGGEEYRLYSDEWDKQYTADVYEFTLKSGESVERTLKFSRLPENYKNYEKYYSVDAMPKGKYRLRVRFQTDNGWLDTDIVIHAG